MDIHFYVVKFDVCREKKNNLETILKKFQPSKKIVILSVKKNNLKKKMRNFRSISTGVLFWFPKLFPEIQFQPDFRLMSGIVPKFHIGLPGINSSRRYAEKSLDG